MITGQDAKTVCGYILKTETMPGSGEFADLPVCGWWREGRTFVAFDNRYQNCNVEEFENKSAMYRWLNDGD